jgi:hypothetical protein
VYGAVPPVGVKLIAPVAEPHCDCVKMNSPFTPPFTLKLGYISHLGAILFGKLRRSLQVPLGVVHAPHIFEIFTISPQV